MTDTSGSAAGLAAGEGIGNRCDLDGHFSSTRLSIFLAVLSTGLITIAASLYADISLNNEASSHSPLFLLAIALTIALAFEFVNGFHDTANAAAAVIYTHTLKPATAVIWSGLWNFAGVACSSGAVAISIMTLLPGEILLKTESGAGFSLIFAMLISAILWNLGTWYLGLPSSSSHALIGSIMGVYLIQHLSQANSASSAVDLNQAEIVGWSLLLSPFIGFAGAALLLLLCRLIFTNGNLFSSPTGKPPPIWIRLLLIFTCTGVSFAHGSNDGQKGMGLIMLILIGAFPSVYALNRSLSEADTRQLVESAYETQAATRELTSGDPQQDPWTTLEAYTRGKKPGSDILGSLSFAAGDIAQRIEGFGDFTSVPTQTAFGLRRHMQLTSRAILQMEKEHSPPIGVETLKILRRFNQKLETASYFVPLWVKMAVALALGMGTMVGWKRIVITVGEKIGRGHLSYAHAGSAEVMAIATIIGADTAGLPVSTTHVLSSGVAGAMAADRLGLQWDTVRNLALAWILTLPAAMVLSGTLYYCFT